MSQTANLQLPYIAAAQAQKHVTHNEALAILDVLVHCAVESRNIASPPPAPQEGERYIVADGATGAWAGKEGRLAAWSNGAWLYHAPAAGLVVFIKDEGVLLIHDGSGLRALFSSFSELGVNATADSANRLAVAGPASLFSHDGADHRLKLNRKLATDTASILFQTDHSARGEIGLAGSDALSFKVSPDGQAWQQALSIDPATGALDLPVGIRYPGYWRFFHSSDLIVTGSPTAKLVWDSTSHNPDGAYDTATGDFTAPASGIYLIVFSFNTNGATTINVDAEVNGAAQTRIQITPNSYLHMSKTFLVAMQKDDVLNFVVKQSSTARFDAGGGYDNVVILRLGAL